MLKLRVPKFKPLQLAEGPVLVEQLRLIYAGMTVSVVPMFPAIALLVATLLTPENRYGLLAWAAVVCGCSSYSIVDARRRLACGLTTQAAPGLARQLMLSTAAGGAAWGALAFGALGHTTPIGGAVVISVLAGILGGSVGLLSSVPAVFIAFAVPLVGLTVAKLWLLGDPAYNAFGVIALLYVGVLVAQARNAGLATRAAIELRFENVALIRQAEAAQRQAQAAQRAAEEANAAKSKFLAAASHDLRQPIHAQGLFLDVLGRTPLTPQQRALVASISATSAASAEMLGTLLDFSRIEAGVVKPQMEPVRVQHLLNKIEREFEPQADANGLAYRSRESALVVQSDPALLELILRNLVSNAIRYTHAGGVLVACRQRGTQAMLEVWDTGIGIAPEQQREVFREFHQLGNPERDRQKGLGLGLAIAQGLARTLGHSLTLVSRPERGSAFKLALPISAAAPELHSLEAAPAAGMGTAALPNLRVLVIDDDDTVLHGMAQLLRSWGCTVDTASAIEGALALAALQRPDVLVSDYRLREQATGLQAIAALRQLLGERLPVVLVTGDTAPQRLREAIASGVPLLHKPVAPAQLYRALFKTIQKAE